MEVQAIPSQNLAVVRSGPLSVTQKPSAPPVNEKWRLTSLAVAFFEIGICLVKLGVLIFSIGATENGWFASALFGTFPYSVGWGWNGTLVYMMHFSDVLIVTSILVEFYSATRLLASTNPVVMSNNPADAQSKVRRWLVISYIFVVFELIGFIRSIMLLNAGLRLPNRVDTLVAERMPICSGIILFIKILRIGLVVPFILELLGKRGLGFTSRIAPIGDGSAQVYIMGPSDMEDGVIPYPQSYFGPPLTQHDHVRFNQKQNQTKTQTRHGSGNKGPSKVETKPSKDAVTAGSSSANKAKSVNTRSNTKNKP